MLSLDIEPKALPKPRRSIWDAVIIGGGHNGLVCAAYLARAGLEVLVLERRGSLGGASVTEESWPGYKVSTAAYAAGLMPEKLVRELDLAGFGYRVTAPDPDYLVPYPDGSSLAFWADPRQTAKEITRLSRRDAHAFVEFDQQLSRLSTLLREFFFVAPPRLAAGDILSWFRVAARLRRWSMTDLADVARLFTLSAADFLDAWFDDDRVKALLATQGIIGAWAGPMTPGTAYLLLHHWMGDVNGRAWGWPRGGMGSLTAALAASAQAHGARIARGAAVSRIIIDDNAARGVELADGRKIRARQVISGAHPATTLLGLVGEAELDPDALEAIRRYRSRSGAVKINYGLSDLPEIAISAGARALLARGTMIGIAPSVEYLERAWDDAKYGRFSERPFAEFFFPSVLEPQIAPPDRHLSLAFTQYCPYEAEERDEGGAYCDAVERVIDEVAPGFTAAIVEREVLGPRELERRFGLHGGNIFQGEMTPDQMFIFRPIPGFGGYRTPVEQLYLCGSGTHPGGGVTGVPGYNCAQVALAQCRWKRTRRDN